LLITGGVTSLLVREKEEEGIQCIYNFIMRYVQRTILLERALPIRHMLFSGRIQLFVVLVSTGSQALKVGKNSPRFALGRYGTTLFHVETQIVV
ncbi:hypothetical protein J6590_103105, partial [Homalodisca vitripennis]